MPRNKNKGKDDVYLSVTHGLRDIYKNKLLPLEKEYFFHDFHSPALDDPDFEAKPMVMLVGQYSTGKTTFIRYILEQDFPGIRIGPEPTTDGYLLNLYSYQYIKLLMLSNIVNKCFLYKHIFPSIGSLLLCMMKQKVLSQGMHLLLMLRKDFVLYQSLATLF